MTLNFYKKINILENNNCDTVGRNSLIFRRISGEKIKNVTLKLFMCLPYIK